VANYEQARQSRPVLSDVSDTVIIDAMMRAIL